MSRAAQRGDCDEAPASVQITSSTGPIPRARRIDAANSTQAFHTRAIHLSQPLRAGASESSTSPQWS